MADEHAQVQVQEDQWWAVDAFPDSPSAASLFDEPLQWPDAPAYAAEPVRAAPSSGPSPATAAPDAAERDSAGRAPDSADDTQWLAALGLGSGADWSPAGPGGAEPAPDIDLHLDPLPESLWAPDPVAPQESPAAPEPLIVTSAMPGPSFYAEPDRGPGRRGRQWLDVRHGNAAVVALISLVSLVLVGMFLSVRARNDLAANGSPSPPPTGQIQVQGTLNTIPQPTTATTTAPPAISLSDLLPQTDTAGAGSDTVSGGGSEGGTSGGGGSRSGAPATTAAPSRSAAPAGGSGAGSGSGSPSQPAAASPAPEPEPEPTPPAPSPPADDTSTRPPRTTTPPDTSVPDISMPTFTVPTNPTTPDWFSSRLDRD